MQFFASYYFQCTAYYLLNPMGFMIFYDLSMKVEVEFSFTFAEFAV
mgnify:CR=1 FL=1|jgi:hypothetical protein